ncbi:MULTISPECIES: nuclear transport factor 2 family protein [unclassified Mycobacterium]|uniref:nuclear transport factor 2 family protein n=1 Tax=unclassified Mycobacterium TaxID=2642494 RepID=UPI0029C8E47E|nr:MULTISPECIES: nuclear transport factor 2 family protein [unclassified Mycobacterium]
MPGVDDVVTGPARAAAMQLLVDYARLLDYLDADAWSLLFGADGVMAVGTREISGRSQLKTFAEQSTRGVHVCGAPDLRLHGNGQISALSSFIFMASTGGTTNAGWYTDTLTPQADGYVFARRFVDVRARS